MNILDRIRKSTRQSVTTVELFLSSFMNEILLSKLRHICSAYKVATPSLTVIYDEKDGMTAGASLKDIVINAGHTMFDGDDEVRLLKVSGVLLHEIGHILFTNYTAWFVWERNMKLGMFYPALPDVSSDLEDSRAKIISLAVSPVGDGFIRFAKDLNNILEDGRIENFILKYVRNARFMTKGLVKLRRETYAEMPVFEELITKVAAGKMPKLIAMQQLILHYARFREVKGTFDHKSELGELLLKLMPEIEAYLDAPEAIVCYGAFNRMLVILEETSSEYFEQRVNEQSQLSEEQKQAMSGASAPGNQQVASGGSSASQGASQNANGTSGAETQGSSGSACGQAALSPEEQASMEAAAESISAKLQAALDQLIGKTADQSATMSDNAKGSDRGSVKRCLAELAKGEGGKVTPPDAATADDGTGTTTHLKDDTNLNLVLEDIARKISDQKVEEEISKSIRSEYEKVSRSVKDYSKIHKNCDIDIYHYDGITDNEVEAYNQIAQAVSPLVKRAVKSSNFYEKDREAYTEDRLFSGSTLHAEQSYRKDGRIFSKTYDRDEPPKVAVAVRVDCSGSMSGSRMEAARRCCVFLYEYVLGMEKRYGVKIPLYIYGDNVSCNVSMYVFADEKFRTVNEKYRLTKMQPAGCNRDGLPIRMAVKRLEQEQPDAQKVLFVITDGQPNDHGYGGEPAFDDLRDITHYCEKKRIALAACAIGSDRDTIEDIYGANHFMNISDLNELPVRLVKILKKLLK